MAPSKKKAKKAAAHSLSDNWVLTGSDYPNDLDYPTDDSDYPDYMEEDDTDSHSDQCLLMSGDEQTMAEDCARARALAAKLAAKRNKAHDGEEAANEDYPPANEDVTPSEVANGGATGGEAYDEDRETVGEERTADPETRLIIIQDSVMQIERTWTQDVDFDREIVEKLVCRHLHSRRRQSKKTPNFHKIWTYTDIVIDSHWEEIDKLAAEMSGAKAGSPAYLGCYKRAIKTVNDQLDEEIYDINLHKYCQI
ncbi:hypothetical protein EI94DRAFT_1705733 [Lactarius quietus]|nr:hypothetical protein EI94DRAFT_1705733 [Lactarius quietus]